LAVKFSRRKRCEVAANVIVAVFEEAGSNVALLDATRVVNVLPRRSS
jgi:hypothetical protein